MNPLSQPKTSTPLLITLTLLCFALLPKGQAVVPPPDGGYPGGNTAEGEDALFSLTNGDWNTALGFNALYRNTIGRSNTATGALSLYSNTGGTGNTANGFYALNANTNGFYNTASGEQALASNTTGDNNTANGIVALVSNTTGNNNTATGAWALFNNTTTSFNTANGFSALYTNTNGFKNTASGASALRYNTTGHDNTAHGNQALLNNSSGSFNIAIGSMAGANLTTGNNNIDIGGLGAAGESDTIRIGRLGLQNSTFIAGIFGAATSGSVVVVNANGKLGVTTSSGRFKDDIKPMGKASEMILQLKPVTFRYKEQIDPDRLPQFGLVAEDVGKVNSDLVVRDKEGKPYTVRYEAVNAMLLNEFLKEHRKNEEQEATIAQLKSGMEALAATVKEQASQIQKVSAQLEASKPAPRVVNNNQ